MNRLAEIVQKRERLAARAEEQRRTIAESLAGCQRVLSVADRGVAWARWARGHPVLIAVATAALVAARPRLGLRWAVRGLTLWRTGRFALDLVRTLAAMRAGRYATGDQPPVRTSGQS
jgi:YqjK-like protein